jgi:hypothetical protein
MKVLVIQFSEDFRDNLLLISKDWPWSEKFSNSVPPFEGE